jgi:hypothetical protein
MSIAIIIEDGSIVTNANSFVTIAEARSYALQRGVELSAIDDEVAAQLIKASDYLESFAEKYKGEMVSFEQFLQWPRLGVYLYNSETEFPSNLIPKELKNAQCAVVLAIAEGVEIMPNYSNADFVIEETVGPITTKYADPVKTGVLPTLTAVDALLQPLLVSGLSGFSIRTIRV